jgi:hypothetical protein
MRTYVLVNLLLALLMAGCGGVTPTPATPSQAPSTQAAAPPVAAASAPEPKPAEPPVVARTEPSPFATERPAPSASETKGANAESPAVKAPAKAAAQTGPQATRKGAAQEPAKKEAVPEPAKQKAEPPLDLASLETRLKETKAIGVMTKIALKNQVDDLLNQFRAFYAGKLKTTLAELRRPYDLLVLKVLSLLQDSDPSLAAAIVASREAIWGILSDPVKFANVASN